jgi:EAL domain-containing protein (putative c-di-GMP-specific phosphodiesterase class I)
VVAEGIETGEQAKILQEMNCQLGQGYYFSKPLAEEDFLKWTNNFDQQLISS